MATAKPGARCRIATPTTKPRSARTIFFDLLAVIEADWPETFLKEQDNIRAFVAGAETAYDF